MSETILIVDDELSQLKMTETAVAQKLGYNAITVAGGPAAIERIAGKVPDLMLLDLAMPEMDGFEVLRRVRASCPQLPIIALTEYGENEIAVRAIQAGADDFLSKPVALERLRLSIQSALSIRRMKDIIARLERSAGGQVQFSDIIGQNSALKEAVARAEAVAAAKMPVWIEGKVGTGKELLARAIHGTGRPGKPFVVLDCALLTENGDMLQRRWREAESGTLYLANVITLAPALQQRLVECMNQNESGPRLISAGRETEPGMFHPELSRRLKNVTITLPPLDMRRSDIPLLAKHFVSYYAAAERKNMYGLTEPALQHLLGTAWPGNVRQLAQLLRRSVLMCNQELLDVGNIRLMQQLQPSHYQEEIPVLLDPQGRVKKLKAIEEEAIRLALHHAGGCMTRAARNLGIGRSTLYRRVSELEVGGYISRANQTTRPMMKVSSTLRS